MIHMKHIRNIIFDLGNVIIDIDTQPVMRAFTALGIQDPQAIFTLQKQNAVCDRFECGFSGAEEFLTTLRTYSHQDDISLAALQQAWEAMILDTTPERLAILKALRTRYRIFLLSNTNEIHYRYINEHCLKKYHVDSLDTLFDKAYYSFQIGHRKPTIEIFQHVLADSALQPEETLFVDDLLQNIDTAKHLKIHTLHASNLKDTWSALKKLAV